MWEMCSIIICRRVQIITIRFENIVAFMQFHSLCYRWFFVFFIPNYYIRKIIVNTIVPSVFEVFVVFDIEVFVFLNGESNRVTENVRLQLRRLKRPFDFDVNGSIDDCTRVCISDENNKYVKKSNNVKT